MLEDALRIFTAQPIDEPDRATIKWPKQKWKLARRHTIAKPKSRKHPGTKDARLLLETHNIPLHICQDCGMEGKMQIHHKDGNPYNNDLTNLKVLCQACHQIAHHFSDVQGVKPWYHGTIIEW